MTYSLFSHIKYNFILLFFFILFTNSYSQDQSDYNLLWKIEGQGLLKPSYIFGTMHVDDSRAFKFSDAVLPAIENSEVFALEVNPDSLMTAMINKVVETDPKELFKALLDDDEYDLLVKRFLEVNDFSFEDSPLKDPNTILALLMPEEDKSDDKTLFVDLYLYNQAKTMQRSITGLENMYDQLNYFENLSTEHQREYILSQLEYGIAEMNYDREQLTKIYFRGNLQAIDSMISEYDGYDLELTARNNVMVNSIIKIIKDKTLFSAVGAAHLPGENGIISLLQKKGYSVTPVEANFTGVADTYEIDESKMIWYSFEDTELGYTVEVPEKPNFSEDLSDFAIHIYKGLYIDTMYLFYAFILPKQNDDTDSRELIEKFANTIAKSYDGALTEIHELSVDDGIKYEGIINLEDGEIMKINLTVKNGILFYLAVQDEKENINSKSIKRFFKSLTITQPKVQEAKPWITYQNANGAFSIDLPEEPNDVSSETPNPIDLEGDPYQLNMYMLVDYVNNNNYLIRYNDFPLGYYMQDIEAGFDEIKENFELKAKVISSGKVIYLDRYKGREYEILVQEKYHAFCRVYFRGNRTYLLLNQKLNDTDEVDINDRFFSSFKFDDYLEPELTTLKRENNDFQILLFENNRLEIDTLDYDDSYVKNSNDYYSKNTATGSLYQFGYSDLQDYFRIKSKSEFYDLNMEFLAEWNDTIIKQSKIMVDNNEGLEFYIQNKRTKTKTRHQFWLNNKRLYLLSAFVGKEELNNATTDSIFNSFKAKPAKAPFDIFSSKTDAILKGLKSKDSIVYKRAFGALNYYEFEDFDLNKLHKAIAIKYKDSLKNEEIKNRLVEVFTVVNDEETLKILETEYKNPQATDDLKTNILLAIPQLSNKNKLTVYSDLLFSNPPKETASYDWSTLSPFKDSLEFSASNYKKLLTLLPHARFRRDVLNISSDIISDSTINNAIVIDNYTKLNAYYKDDISQYYESKKDEDSYDYTYSSLMYAYASLYNKTNHDSGLVDEFTQSLIENDDNEWLIIDAITARIIHNLKVEDTIITSYLENKSHTMEIIKAYHKTNALNKVPAKYLDTKEIAKTAFFAYVSEEGDPSEIKHLGEITQDSNTYYVLSYNYSSEDDEEVENYVGIVGPISEILQSKPLELPKSYTDWDDLEDDWKAQGENLILDLIEYGY